MPIPGFAIFQHVERPVGTKEHVYRIGEAGRRHKLLHGYVIPRFVHRNRQYPVPHPVVDEQFPVVIARKFPVGFGVIVVIIDGSRHGVAPPFPGKRKFFGRTVRIPDESRLRGRKRRQPRVVGGIVYGRGRVEGRARRFRLEIVIAIGLVVPHEVRPAEIARRARLIHFVVPHGASLGGRLARVGTHLSPVQIPCPVVDGNAERISIPHHVNFGTALHGAVCEEIAFRDVVRSVVVRQNPQYLPAQVHGVGGRPLRIPRLAPRSFVDGRKTV